MEGLVARPLEGLLPVCDPREPLRVAIASLAPGGAERIVLEWLAAESARGREVELAVLHPRRVCLRPPAGVRLRVRARQAPEEFLRSLAFEWRGGAAPVSAHLLADEHLAAFWREGIATVPVVHNARPGWRNDPSVWRLPHVPCAVACAEAVRREMIEAGCRVPVATLRHRPAVGPAALDPAVRARVRTELAVAPDTFLVAAIGAFKPQKDHARALRVVAELARSRDCALVVLGGLLDPAGAGELDRLLAAAVELGMADRLRLPGFVREIEPWLAACDALLNVSRFEGLSIAVQEALAAGLPVVAAAVGGQREIAHPALELVEAGADEAQYADRLAGLPVRARLDRRPFPREPRAWSLTVAARPPAAQGLDTLFVTANLNAGGAQRSLVNLALALRGRHRFAVAVCSAPTHPAFARELASAGVEAFQAAHSHDDVALAESLLAHVHARGCRTLCFWNVAPGVKLLASRFAPPGLRIVDVSPGRYAFDELEGARSLAEALDWPPQAYYARLDALVVKHAEAAPPAARRIVRIPNGVAPRPVAPRAAAPRYLVSGRIAPSKRLEVIVAALQLVRREAAGAELHVYGIAEPRHAAYAATVRGDAPAGVCWRGADFALACLAEPWTAAVVLGTHQGCPNAVLEAMAAGIPVVANASGGTGELVAEATGWLLPEHCTPVELAAALLAAWTDASSRDARGAAARAHVRERFGIGAMAARYLELLAPEAPKGRATIDA